MDVVLTSGYNKGIVECKYPNVTTGDVENNIISNLEEIIKKFRSESKLTSEWKSLYPKQYGQIKIANGAFPDLSSAQEFVSIVKSKGVIGDIKGVSKFTLNELKDINELHIITTNNKRIIIKPTDW